MDEPKVAIIVPNYNGASVRYRDRMLINLCLDSIKKTSYKNYQIVIPDDCSTDNSVEYLLHNYPEIRVIRNRINGGYAKNTNSGIRYALLHLKPKYIVQCNDDIIIKDRDWLAKLVGVAERNKKIGMVGCKLLYPDGRIQSTEYDVGAVPRYVGRSELDSGQYNYIKETTGVSGALAVTKSTVIRKIGLLDENYYMGFDDADYAIRVRKAGFKIVYNGEVEATHIESATNPGNVNDKRFYLVQVGYVYFAFKHLGFVQKINALLHELVGAVFTIDAPGKTRSLSNIKFRNKPLWRLYVSIKAIFDGYSRYVNSKASI